MNDHQTRDEVLMPIRWWTRAQFTASGVLDPVCDTCSEPLDEFPAAVVGTYAACSQCRRTKWFVEPGDQEYFESSAYNVGEVPKRPRENCGGRASRT
jgi:hypothetical protein